MEDRVLNQSSPQAGLPQQQGFVSSTLSDDAFLALLPVKNHLYVTEHATGTAFMRLVAEPSPYLSHEARYFPERELDVPGKGRITGVWVVVSRVDQSRLQALAEGMEIQHRYQLLDAQGQLFTESGFSLSGAAEQVRLLHSANTVHEDPVSGLERGESTVLLRFSNSGQPLVLEQVAIQAAHGRITHLRYALNGMSDQEVLRYLETRVTIREPLDAGRQAEWIRSLRSTLVEGLYRADQTALQALEQDQQLAESGFAIEGLNSHVMAPPAANARIVLQGKGEALAPPFTALELQLNEADIADRDGARGVIDLRAAGFSASEVAFSAPPADSKLTSGGVPLLWRLTADHQELCAVSGGKAVLKLRIETESGRARVQAQLMAGLDHAPASSALESVLQLDFGQKGRAAALSLVISDDQPVVDPYYSRTALSAVPSNLVLVVDISCLLSGDRTAGWQQLSPQEAVLSMMHKLLARYEGLGETRVHFVLYGLNDQGQPLLGSGWNAEGALYVNPFWGSAAEAHAMLDNGGFTSLLAQSSMPPESYQLALKQVMEIFRIADRVEGDTVKGGRNEMVLISAGQPQHALSGSMLREWEQFVASQSLSVRALGIERCRSDSAHADSQLWQLQQLASEPWRGGGKNARLLGSDADIDHVLASGWRDPQAVASVERPLGRVGADGGYVSEVEFGGLRYLLNWQERSLNGYQDTDWHKAHTGWDWRFDADNRALHFRSASEQIQLYLDEAKYSYSRYRSQAGATLQLGFTLTDGDGDRCAGRLLIDAAGSQLEPVALPDALLGSESGVADPVWGDVPYHPRYWSALGTGSSVDQLDSMLAGA